MIRKGDMVMVIVGKEKGKTARVLWVNRAEQTILLEKLNMVKRHQKPNQKHRQGGIIEKEVPLALSNVMYYDTSAAKPTRLGFKIGKDGAKLRIARRSGEVIDTK